VFLAGKGSGAVTSSPPGINCGTTCSANFAAGTTLTLTAAPAPGSSFSTWSGDCSGAGPCTLTALYGDSVYATFNSAIPDFSLTPASSNLTVAAGGQQTDTITIASQNGVFGNPVQLTCTVSGPSPKATCGLSQSSVTPGTTAATSTLTVSAPMSAAFRSSVRPGKVSQSRNALWLPMILGIAIWIRSERRRYPYITFFSLALLLLFAQIACGGGSPQMTVQTPPPMNYVVAVTGTGGAVQHTIQVNVTVQ